MQPGNMASGSMEEVHGSPGSGGFDDYEDDDEGLAGGDNDKDDDEGLTGANNDKDDDAGLTGVNTNEHIITTKGLEHSTVRLFS
jgi:hypothetical protein